MPIREQRTFVDEKGNTVHELRPLDPDVPQKSSYFAIGPIVINGQQTQDQFRFDIAADSLAEAFERLEHAFQLGRAARIAELNAQFKALAEQQRRQIVLPNGQKLPPNGHPKTRFK